MCVCAFVYVCALLRMNKNRHTGFSYHFFRFVQCLYIIDILMLALVFGEYRLDKLSLSYPFYPR